MSRAADILSPTSSSRSSLDQRHPGQPRRHRGALRDYYNLPPAAAAQARADALGSNPSAATSVTSLSSTATEATAPPIHAPASVLVPLDQSSFDADKYIRGLLADGSLQDLLKVQAALAHELGGIDGERKGLVYDNYGRLIGARDVVAKVGAWLGGKDGMEKLGALREGIATLPPRVNALVGHDPHKESKPASDTDDASLSEAERQHQENEVVRWVLAGPKRVQALMTAGRSEDAVRSWRAVEEILDTFGDVEGADLVRSQGQAALRFPANG